MLAARFAVDQRWEEAKAALTSGNDDLVCVRRNREVTRIRRQDLVVGDIVVMYPAGRADSIMYVPADGVVVRGQCVCDEGYWVHQPFTSVKWESVPLAFVEPKKTEVKKPEPAAGAGAGYGYGVGSKRMPPRIDKVKASNKVPDKSIDKVTENAVVKTAEDKSKPNIFIQYGKEIIFAEGEFLVTGLRSAYLHRLVGQSRSSSVEYW
jgi:hypothetical protein